MVILAVSGLLAVAGFSAVASSSQTRSVPEPRLKFIIASCGVKESRGSFFTSLEIHLYRVYRNYFSFDTTHQS
jgi:hypothetical protein